MSMRGFTLIEVVIYIALLGLLMTGAVITASDLLESAGRSSAHATTQEEGSFAARKMEWALADMSAAPTIGGSGCDQTLGVMKTNYPKNPVVFRRATLSGKGYIEMSEAGGVFAPLTTANVSVSCLKITQYAGSPSGITATTTVDSADFAVTKYLRI